MDVDGPKVKAIAVEYACDLSGVKVNKDTFAIELNDTSVAVNAKSRNFGGGEIGVETGIHLAENGHKVHAIVSPYKTVSVDTPKDLALVNTILKEKQHG